MRIVFWDHLWTVALVVFSVASAWTGRRRTRSPAGAETRVWSSSEKWSAYLGGSATLWLLGGGTLAVWLLNGRELAQLGFRRPEWTRAAIIIIVAFGSGLVADTLRQLSPARIERTRDRWLETSPFMPATPGELGRYALLAASAGFGEEIAYRGFLIAYLGAYFGLQWPGLALVIGLPALFFGVAHADQGARGLLGSAAWALALGFIVVDTGSLWPAIVFHAAWDTAMGLPGLRLLGPAARS